jgi:dTDP-4-amino-4,6-dideoxygalactose transaminase
LKGVLATGWYILGNEVKELKRVASIAGNIAGTGNGLDALVLILKHTFSWGNYKGDEVIVPANTYIASILAILKQI